MMQKEPSNNSIVSLLVRRFSKRHSGFKQNLLITLYNSVVFQVSKNVRQKISCWFKYSYVGKIDSVIRTICLDLNDSRVVQYLFGLYALVQKRTRDYLNRSLSLEVLGQAKKELYSHPVRIASLILVTAIFVNVILGVALHKPIFLGSSLIKVLFLLWATAGLSFEADWPVLKETSALFKKL